VTPGSRLSICIPVFNGAATIAELLGSIRDQSFTDFDVLISDDASTDSTISVIEPFFDDPRFQLIQRDKNIGFVANLIQLIEAAPKNDFLIFPGQDDIWLPGLLEKHVQFLDANPEVGVVHSRCSLIDRDGNSVEKHQWYWDRLSKKMGGADLIEALLTHNFVCFPAATVRRLALEDVKQEFCSRRFTYVPDWWLWLLISGRGWAFGYLPEADCKYRVHSQQLTQTLGYSFRTRETSLVLSAFANLLDGERFGRQLSKRRRNGIRHIADARLLRRGIAMILRTKSKREGWKLVKTALRNDSLSAPFFPFLMSRYLMAKAFQHHDCSGMPELFHSLGKP
jgi:glycosyltransferase involved in cell wall biosynthesis